MLLRFVMWISEFTFSKIVIHGCPFVAKFNHCNFWFELIFFIQFDLFLLIQCNHLVIFDLIFFYSILFSFFFLLIQCNLLTTIDSIRNLDFLFNLILRIFVQFNPSFFIQSYWDEVVDLFYWGEFYVKHVCCLWNIENRWWREKVSSN